MNPSAREMKLESVLHAYLQAVDAGQRPDRDLILREHPELANELRDFFADQEKMDRYVHSMHKAKLGDATIGADGALETVDSVARVKSFGDYELLEEIARGGMGVVFKARQVSLNRIVALKMILRGELAGAAEVQRFKTEAEAAANLDHPNIVPIYEIGEQEGNHYYSMKLIEGGNLAALVPSVGAPTRKAFAALSTVARAVHFAHQRGILHRDLKPANILLDANDEPMVSDFGLAKRVEGGSDVTRSGAILGTPSYMAPEQARAEKGLSTAVDVYSLGAMLFELLTGRPPFKAETPMETLVQALEKEPDRPSRLKPGCDRDLETICLKCLEKEPGKRYSSAEALADDLDRWLAGQPILARPTTATERAVKWARRQPLLASALAGMAAAAIGLLVLAGFLWHQDRLIAGTVQDLNDAKGRLSQTDAELREIDEKRKKAEVDRVKASQLADEQRKIADEQMAIARRQKALADEIDKEAQRLQAEADRARQDLVKARAEAMRTLYAADMQLAHAAWQSDNAATASELVARYRDPGQLDVRGLEWHYLHRQIHSARLSWRESPDAKVGGMLAALGYSPDGNTLATALVSGKVKLWNRADGKLLQTIDAKKANIAGLAWGNVTGLFFEADGKRLVLVLRKDFDMKQLDKMVAAAIGKKEAFQIDSLRTSLDFQVFDLDNPARPRIEPFDPARLTANLFPSFAGGLIVVHDGNMVVVSSMERSPDGRFLALAGMETKVAGGNPNAPGRITGGRIIVWDLQEKRIHAQQASPVPISAIAFAPKGPNLAIATADGAVGLGKIDLAQPPRVMTGHQGTVYSLTFTRDGNQLLSGAMDGVVILWDVASAKEANRYRGHTNAVSRVAVHDQSLASASLDGIIKVWDLGTRQGARVLHGHTIPIVAFAFPNNGADLASVDLTGQLRTWRLVDGKPLGSVQPKQVKSLNVVLSKSGRTLAWKEEFLGPTVTVRDLASGKDRRLAWGNRLPFVLTLSPDDKWLAASDLDKGATLEKGGLVVWNLADGKVAASLDDVKGLVNGLTFSADSKFLAAAHQNGVILWDWQAGERRPLVRADQMSAATAIAISSDNKQIAAAFEESLPEGKSTTIRIWDLASGEIRCECRSAGQRVLQLAFSPRGDRLASAGTSSAQLGQLKLWDTISGREVFSAPVPRALISPVAFSPDGRRLLAAVNPFDPWASIAGRPTPSDIYIWEQP